MCEPFALPRTGRWSVEADGRAYRAYLAWPDAPPPPGGFPVLLVLDANAGFATAVEAHRAHAWRTTLGAPAPSLILGLGHPGEAPYDTAARARDYAPARPGGADAFLDFVEARLLPELERRHPVDRARLGVFGHSLGGLLVVHALLTRPGLFRRLVAASPSLWWGDGAVLRAARRFADAPPPEAARARLLVTAGGLEESGEGPRGALRAARRMIGNARDLVALLRGAGLAAEFAEFSGEDHGSVRTPALARAVRFALPGMEEPA